MILSPEVGVNQYTGILKVKQMHTQKKKKEKKKTCTKLKGCGKAYCKIIFQVIGFHGSENWSISMTQDKPRQCNNKIEELKINDR